MPLKLATLSYGSARYDVTPNETLPLPAEFDFDQPEDCARLVAAIMSNASGGHRLRAVRLSIHRKRCTANITAANGAHVYYAPENSDRLSAEQAAQVFAEATVFMLGDVTTDQYGDGWQRASWEAATA